MFVYVLTCETVLGQSSILGIYRRKEAAEAAVRHLLTMGNEEEKYAITKIVVNPL